jgi:predicted transcriptional regulator
LNKKLNEQIDWTDEIKSLVSNGMATGVMVDMDEYQKHVQNVFNNFVDQIIDNSKLKTFTTKRSINGSTDIDRRLAIAKDLYEKGSITKEEYESKRKEILGGL